MTILDEDARQEYECLLLEGHDEDEALRLAKRAGWELSRFHQLRPPTTTKPRHNFLSLEWTEEDGEQFHAYQKAEPIWSEPSAELDANAEWALGMASPREKEILTKRFGLDGSTPRYLSEIAVEEGCHLRTLEGAVKRYRQRCADFPDAVDYADAMRTQRRATLARNTRKDR